MSIFRSNNPLEFDLVDGIVIDETAPAPNVKAVGTGIAILVGLFERGPTALLDVPSTAALYQTYGKGMLPGMVALQGKKFSQLRIARVDVTNAVLATRNFLASATSILTITPKQGKGAYGNGITVKIEAGSVSGKKYTITDTNPGAVLPQEIYDNVAVASIVSSGVFVPSQLINVVVNSTASDPDNIAATALATGSDGTASDADYQAAIDKCAVERAGNVLFLDEYNTTRNAALKAHAIATQDKMVIVAGPKVQTVSAAVTDAALNRDTEGRIIYAYPWLEVAVAGVPTMVSPASFYASVISQTAPSVDPASADNVSFLLNVTNMQIILTRADYITLMAAGVSAFEYDGDLGGFKIKSGIVTQVANSSKLTVARRRMADFLTNSIGVFLKLYQNGQNSKKVRNAIKGAILNFIKQQEDNGILPKDSEVIGGTAKVVDTEVLNTNESIAAGFLKILYRQRIFSSNRFIVLQAEIGESVVVTEA